MRNTRIPAIITLLAVMFSFLPGCSLALADTGPENADIIGQDLLIGVLITTSKLPSEGPVYAEQITSSTGEVTFEFAGVNGFRFFEGTVTGIAATDTYMTTIGDEEISEATVSITAGDTADLDLRGTLYLTNRYMKSGLYINSVYQDSDGNVYAVAEPLAIGVSAPVTATLQESYEADESTIISRNVNISIQYMALPTRIVLLQMSDDGTVIRRDEYEPGSLPASITANSGTDYIVAQTYGENGDGEQEVSHTLYEHHDTYITTYLCGENAICIGQTTSVIWP